MDISHGMSLDEIQDLGTRLQRAYAESVRQVATEIDRQVSSSPAAWVGPDAERFRSWWPEKRARLMAIADDLHGFGQSALNNVSEQRQASGDDRTSGGATVTPGPSTPTPGGGGGSAGSALRFDAGARWTDHWERRGAHDQWNFGYDGDGDATHGNCTSFVAWRLNELGDDGYRFDNNKVVFGDGSRHDYGELGNAGEWWANAPGELRSSEPAPGMVLVWESGDGQGSDGHVAVVKDVHPDGSITIEDSAWDRWTYREKTLRPGEHPGKFLNFLPRS